MAPRGGNVDLDLEGIGPLAGQTVAPRSAAVELEAILKSPEIARLIADLEATRWTGEPHAVGVRAEQDAGSHTRRCLTHS